MKTPGIFLIVALLAGATCAAQNVKVTYCTSEIVRIEKSADGAGRSQKSVSVILEPSAKVLKPKVKVGGESRLFSPTRRKGRCLGDACQVTGFRIKQRSGCINRKRSGLFVSTFSCSPNVRKIEPLGGVPKDVGIHRERRGWLLFAKDVGMSSSIEH